MERSLTEVETVAEQILKLAKRHPDSIALVSGDGLVSYGELALRADRFAGHLTQLGVLPGDAVAICMERSFDWIVSALGIMRAGAAYVPLDSAWPVARLRYAVNDSGATVLVARAALLGRLQVKVRGVDPCRDDDAIASACYMVNRPIQLESLAYVIYTSGSSGVPKGVEITHASLANLIRWHSDAFAVTSQDRVSHLLGLGFDAAVLEIWAHLCAGATLCFPSDGVQSSPELIQDWMLNDRVTIGIVPAVLGSRLMAMEWPATSELRLLVTGGDALLSGPPDHLPFEVVNNYGPTECTVVTTWAALKPGARGIPPIGFPIAGASVYLLDEHGELVPDGDEGEIYIGGSGVGRGYRNLPALTESAFLADPFAGAPGARMYRTGDRALRRSDGQLEFRGRLDRQIKIRGQRVELDEIGSILRQHPSIDFATAGTNTSERGEIQLVAHVLLKHNVRIPTAQELRQHLQRRLPDYMVPAIFVRLNALPLSSNGKLDLTSLPHPADSNLLEARITKVPRSRVEEQLLNLVRKILEDDAVVAEDNFFLTGGHSLLGMQLVVALEKTFGVNLTLQHLFEAPTVESLAASLEVKLSEKRLAAIWADLLGLTLVGLDDSFFNLGGGPDLAAALQRRIASDFGMRISIADLSKGPTVRQQAALMHRRVQSKPELPPGVLALQRNGAQDSIFWVHYQTPNLARVVGNNQPFFAVGLTEQDLESFGKSPKFESIAACLVEKILSAQPRGPYVIGGFCIGGILAYEIASQLRSAGSDVPLLVLVDTPDISSFKSQSSMGARLNQPAYFLKRAVRLGLRGMFRGLFFSFRRSLFKRLPRSVRKRFEARMLRVGQETIESAAASYRPEKYEGKVLLLMASDRAPHVNFLPGWQAFVPFNLHHRYLEGHHDELTSERNVQSIADAIVSHIEKSSIESPRYCFTGSCASAETGRAAKETEKWNSMKDRDGSARAGNSTPLTK